MNTKNKNSEFSFVFNTEDLKFCMLKILNKASFPPDTSKRKIYF